MKLTDLDLPEGLETGRMYAFHNCPSLRRITMPLREDMIEVGVFYKCPKLSTVDLVGGIYETVASLHLERWRNEMTEEINRSNQVLPENTEEIRRWITAVIRHIEHYKAEHRILLKEEATTLLNLLSEGQN